MNNYRVNNRYATALYELAVEQNQLEQTYHDILMGCTSLSESRELRLLLKSPIIQSDKKVKILESLFRDKVGIVTWKFIEILVKKRREEHLAGILEAFIEIYRKAENIRVVSVTTAFPLDDSLKKRLLETLKKETGAKEIVLNEKVDEKVVGGILVTVDDKMFDNSIYKKLQVLQLEFSDSTYEKGF
jgi:F-type H+-transporting ATPase subunit delta